MMLELKDHIQSVSPEIMKCGLTLFAVATLSLCQSFETENQTTSKNYADFCKALGGNQFCIKANLNSTSLQQWSQNHIDREEKYKLPFSIWSELFYQVSLAFQYPFPMTIDIPKSIQFFDLTLIYPQNSHKPGVLSGRVKVPKIFGTVHKSPLFGGGNLALSLEHIEGDFTADVDVVVNDQLYVASNLSVSLIGSRITKILMEPHSRNPLDSRQCCSSTGLLHAIVYYLQQKLNALIGSCCGGGKPVGAAP